MNYDKLYINGKWVTPFSKEKIQVEDPATKEFFKLFVQLMKKMLILQLLLLKKLLILGNLLLWRKELGYSLVF